MSIRYRYLDVACMPCHEIIRLLRYCSIFSRLQLTSYSHHLPNRGLRSALRSVTPHTQHLTPHTQHTTHNTQHDTIHTSQAEKSHLEAEGVTFHHPRKREKNWTTLRNNQQKQQQQHQQQQKEKSPNHVIQMSKLTSTEQTKPQR
jgi:hypothetical protein